MSVPLLVLNVLFCESVHRDRDTGKFHLLGISNLLTFSELPATLPIAQLFLSFIEVNGPYNLRIQIVDINEENEPIFQTSGRMEGLDPLKEFQFAMPLVGIEFPEAGEYRLQVIIDDQVLTERKLAVRTAEGNANHG